MKYIIKHTITIILVIFGLTAYNLIILIMDLAYFIWYFKLPIQKSKIYGYFFDLKKYYIRIYDSIKKKI